MKSVPEQPIAEIDCQTTTGISFFNSMLPVNPPDDYQIKKLSDSEFSLRICRDKTAGNVRYDVKLSEGVVWPPNWQKSSNVPEVFIFFIHS